MASVSLSLSSAITASSVAVTDAILSLKFTVAMLSVCDSGC